MCRVVFFILGLAMLREVFGEFTTRLGESLGRTWLGLLERERGWGGVEKAGVARVCDYACERGNAA